MKGVLTGLKNLKQVSENSQRGGGNFLSLKDGQSVTLYFIQELDKAGKKYDETRGLGISVFEHTNPDDFSQRFLCTQEDEGHCVGCERVTVNPRWKRRSRLFINAFVKEENAVRVLATGFSSKGVGGALIEYAEDFMSLCDRYYKLKRTGEGLKTQYTLYPLEVTPLDIDQYQPVDLNNFAKYRSYEEVVSMLKGEDAPAPTKSEDW